MSKTFNKNIIYNYAGPITLSTSSNLNISSNSNTIGNVIFTTGGNVGIGTTAPSSQLHIVTNADASLGMGLNNDNTGANSRININMNVGFSTSGNAGQIYASTSDPTFTMRSYSGNTSGISLLTGGAAPIKFLTQNSERMRVTSSGNVGIGTTAPVSRLHLANPSTQNTNNMVFEVGTTADGAVGNYGWSAINWNGYFNSGETRINTGKNRWRLFVDQRNTGDNLVFDTYNGTTLTTIITLTTNGNVGIGTGNPGYPLTVSSSATQGIISVKSNDARYHLYNNAAVAEWLFGQKSSSRSDFTFSKVISGAETDYLTITTGGNVGIGTNAPGRKLQVEGLVQIGDGAVDNTDSYGALNITQNDTAIGSRAHLALIRAGNSIATMRINTSNQLVIQMTGSGGVYLGGGATAWTANSDRTLKTNFQDIPNPLDKVSQLKGTYYKFKTDSEDFPRRVGVIAQDVQAVLPEIVTTNNEGKLGVSYSELIPLLIEAIKELKKEFTEYKESHP
jgi:hypothetical protein